MPSRLPTLRPATDSTDEAIAFYKQCALYWRNAYLRETNSISRMEQQITELRQAINRVESYCSLGLRPSNMDHEEPSYRRDGNVHAEHPDTWVYPSSYFGVQRAESPARAESDAGSTTEFETDTETENDNDGMDDKDSGVDINVEGR